jgi:nucleotide-binding universal stress UspA family protein
METKLIKLATYTYAKAEVVKSMLEAEGIECFLSNTNLVQPSISQGVEIQVNENDLETVMKILGQAGSETNYPDEKLKNITKILVPIDITDSSRNACYFAFSLANKLNAQIKFIYSYYVPELTPVPMDETFTFSASIPTYRADLKAQAEKDLQRLKKEFGEYLKKMNLEGIHHSYILETGFSDELICQYSKEWHADLIVIGIPKKNEKELLVPSILTSKVVNNVNVPVLIVPEEYIFKSLEKIQNIMYATAYDESDFSSIKKLARLTSPFDVEIRLVHIDNEKSVLNKVKMQVLKDYFTRISEITKISCDLIESDNLLKAIDEYIQKNNINILCILARKRNLITKIISPNITKKILLQTKIPLLVFHG